MSTLHAPSTRHPSPRNSRKTRPGRGTTSAGGATRVFIARGEQVRAIHIRPGTIAAMGVAFLLFSMLYFGSTAYLFLRDDWLRTKATGQAEQAELREAYEDRISALRSEIERIRSRRTTDHAEVEQRVEQLREKQDALDGRQEALDRLMEAARRAGLDVPDLPPIPRGKGEGPQASAPQLARPTVALASVSGIETSSDRIEALDEVEARLLAAEGAQEEVLGAVASGLSNRTDRIAALLKKLGRKVPARTVADVGGPFVPLADTSEAERFGLGVEQLLDQLERYGKLRRLALALPLGRPIASAPITSHFGARLDPFLGRPAMHTGIDFRAPRGYPARSVAAGTVIAAGVNGGYGKMVDVDHGNGIVTRYGHLSAITAKVGDKVAAGGKIGRVGSTGRSTGPHLHYEIRIDGEPINPVRYLSAGKEIRSLL